MSVTNYNVFNYLKGINGYGLPISNTMFSATLAANTEQTVTVPLVAGNGSSPAATTFNKFLVEIQSNAAVWVSVNNTATVPAGGVFASTNSTLVFSEGFYVKSGDVLHFISAAGTDVSVRFYALQDL